MRKGGETWDHSEENVCGDLINVYKYQEGCKEDGAFLVCVGWFSLCEVFWFVVFFLFVFLGGFWLLFLLFLFVWLVFVGFLVVLLFFKKAFEF